MGYITVSYRLIKYLNQDNRKMLKVQSYSPFPASKQGQLRKKIQNYSFFLSDKIGKGYSSNVYKGTNDLTSIFYKYSPDQIVAIKVIQLKSLKDEVTKGLLRIQLQCMKKINHPNLLQYIDSYETINNCYIVTEYCEGGDLQKHVRSRGRFSQKELMQFFHQFYDAYQSFFSAGFIHRDLKPANIFLKNNKIKIADFGFVKRASGPIKESYNVGTPVYMPPQSLTSSIYSQKSDIWSMGVICYQLVHGRVPWQGSSEAELKNKIQNVKPVIDNTLVSRELQNFIYSCLETNPSTRIDLKSIADHPWMQKIKSSLAKQIPLNQLRIPLRDLTNQASKKYLQNNILTRKQSINQLPSKQYIFRKNSISQRQTMDSSDELKYKITPNKNSQKLKNQTNRQAQQLIHLNIKKQAQQLKTCKLVLKSLITIMNLMRFQFKIFRFIQQLVQLQNHKQLLSYVGRSMIQILSQHETIVASKNNLYQLPQWEQFIISQQWDAYRAVVDQYSKKYRKIYYSKFGSISKIELNSLMKQLSDNISLQLKQMQQKQTSFAISFALNNKSREVFDKLQVLDYLTTLGCMQQMLENDGIKQFIEKSPINKIVQCKCEVNLDNFQHVWDKLQSRVVNLRN